MDAPQTRRRGKADALGEVHIGDPALVLEDRENLPIDLVQRDHLRLFRDPSDSYNKISTDDNCPTLLRP